MKKFVALVCSCLLSCMLAGPAAAQELVVSAAGSLTNAFDAVKTEFERINPGVRISPNYASSGALYRQIEQGAPVDVYASADQKWMKEMVSAGFVDQDAVNDFVHNSIVLVVPPDRSGNVTSLMDVTGDQVRFIGIGNPDAVPAGTYAMNYLVEHGLWEGLKPKLIFGETVMQIVDYVRRGEVDAGFIFATEAKRAGDQLKVVGALELSQPVAYPIAPLKRSKQPELGRKFVQFILSNQGQEILAGYGFSQPE
ncbi:MAG: molybdate ABC transporter substrate-binding protein [Deltaproteobacteria bacterium]|nr:molybdate ABC transporter substrate-binding protein [Deltaproteobacteria bacterium]